MSLSILEFLENWMQRDDVKKKEKKALFFTYRQAYTWRRLKEDSLFFYCGLLP